MLFPSVPEAHEPLQNVLKDPEMPAARVVSSVREPCRQVVQKELRGASVDRFERSMVQGFGLSPLFSIFCQDP